MLDEARKWLRWIVWVQHVKNIQNIPLILMMSEFVTGTKTSTYLYIEALWSDNSDDDADVVSIPVLIMSLDQCERSMLLFGVCVAFSFLSF